MQKKQDNDALPADIGGASWYDTLVLYMALVVALAGIGAVVYGGVNAIRDSIKRHRTAPAAVSKSKCNAAVIDYDAALPLMRRAQNNQIIKRK